MDTYSDWYSFTEWANDAWRGKFSPREIAEHAYIYLEEYRVAKEKHHVTDPIRVLISELFDTDGEDANAWLESILAGIENG